MLIRRQELQQKTAYDAAIRYSTILEELEINLEYDSMIQLLHISKIPAYRDRISTLFLYTPKRPVSNGAEDSRESKEEDELHSSAEAAQHALEEAADEFLQSTEAVYLLAHCFENLDGAKRLQRIELVGDKGHTLVLEALRFARYSRKLVILTADPNFEYGSFSTTPEDFAGYVTGLEIQPSLSRRHYSDQRLSLAQREENPSGLHIRNYRPANTGFTRIVSSLANIDSLDLNGCRSHPGLRFCHGCDYLFIRNFAPILFPELTSLVLAKMLISGSRLRKFVKRHADTLVTIKMIRTTLTDGSWRSIAQGLAKIPHLRMMHLAHLWQKRAAPLTSTARPPEYLPSNRVSFEVAGHVKHFLNIFIATFSTVSYSNSDRFRRTPPKYFQAKLFELPSVTIPIGQLAAVAVVRRYAEGSEGH